MHGEITIPALGRVYRDPESQQEISFILYLDIDRVRRWIRQTADQNKTRESVLGPLKILVKTLPPGIAAPLPEESGKEEAGKDCEHGENEDCMNCHLCGKCSETLDEDDLCDDCRTA